jgi:hypothetical protein
MTPEEFDYFHEKVYRGMLAFLGGIKSKDAFLAGRNAIEVAMKIVLDPRAQIILNDILDELEEKGDPRFIVELNVICALEKCAKLVAEKQNQPVNTETQENNHEIV